MMRTWKPGDPIVCRFCGDTNCEHGDHCAACGCPQCGFPGARHQESDGHVRGFCPDCGWEAVPGAYRAWRSRRRPLTLHQVRQKLMEAFGEPPPTDEVGLPIWILRAAE